MIKLEGYKVPQKTNLRVAIVEDNNTARLNLRSHLMSIDGFEISSYSNGKELRNGLRTINFDMVFIDFHLGQAKNGVEWIEQLIEAKAFKPSMGLFFVTSDSQPQTIGQILDLYPDFILIKPYTMKSLATNVRHYLTARRSLLPALKYMDSNRNQMAINYVNEQLEKGIPKRIEADFIKLKGRLLILEKRYDEAISLYSSILEKASGVLWAHWGLIKSEFFVGKWQECQKMLDRLIDESLTKEKAFEWLASVEIGRKNYIHAEQLLDNIRDTDLTIQATRLKVLCYKMQDKTADAIALLDKKVQSNISIKERLTDYAMELARYHLYIAEEAKDGDNSENVSAARVMLGKASRGISDRQSEQQKDNMLALSFLLDDDKPRAERIISETSHSMQLRNANVSSMVDAVKVWFGLGHIEKAKELLDACDKLMLEQESHIDSLIAREVLASTEKSLGLEKERAIAANEKGMQEYRAQNYMDALSYFHRAYSTFPGVPAFALNLLQCLGDCQQNEYKDINVERLLRELENISLSDKNLLRMDSIKEKFKLIA